MSDHESSTYSKDLVLSFPILKVFEAKGCEWSTKQNLCIQVPLLERFSIAMWNSLSNESCKSSIKIFSPHLTDFSYKGDLEQEIILLNTLLIRTASVVIVIDEDRKESMRRLGFQVHKLLTQICEVEQLKLLLYKVCLICFHDMIMEICREMSGNVEWLFSCCCLTCFMMRLQYVLI